MRYWTAYCTLDSSEMSELPVDHDGGNGRIEMEHLASGIWPLSQSRGKKHVTMASGEPSARDLSIPYYCLAIPPTQLLIGDG